jgi:hypothetical protein
MKQFIEQITLEEMRDELKREIKMREKVYPRWIESGRLEANIGNLQVLKLRAVLAFIETELKKNAAQKELFG